MNLIERKAAGEEIAVQPEVEEPAAAPDLMAALEASLAAVRSGDDDEAPKPRRRQSSKSADGDGSGSKSRSKAKAKT
jgi:DNA end-binding protein Ku